MKETTSFQNRLDDSNGTVKNGQNDKMQTSDQPPKTPWFLRLPEAILRKSGLLAVLAVGVDAAASFLKSTMEKTAAVASQVGAAVLKSKKAVSVVLGAIQPKPQKIAVNRLAKAKARFASIPLFTLLTAFFIASLNCIAWWEQRGIWTPFYEQIDYLRVLNEPKNVPYIGRVTLPSPDPYKKPILSRQQCCHLLRASLATLQRLTTVEVFLSSSVWKISR